MKRKCHASITQSLSVLLVAWGRGGGGGVAGALSKVTVTWRFSQKIHEHFDFPNIDFLHVVMGRWGVRAIIHRETKMPQNGMV